MKSKELWKWWNKARMGHYFNGNHRKSQPGLKRTAQKKTLARKAVE